MANEPAQRPSPKAQPSQDAISDAQVVETLTAMPPPTLPAREKATPDAAPAAVPVEASVQEQEPIAPRVEPSPSPAVAQPAPRRSGFVPLVLGGIIAGGIGYGAAYMQFGPHDVVDVSGLQDQIAALQGDVAALPQTDLAPVTQELAGLTSRLDDLDSRLAALDTRVTETAAQAPVLDGDVADAAVSQLSDQIAAQQADLDAQRAALEEQLAATRAEAEAIQAQAVDAARDETARAALARVQGGLETGAPLQEALDDLGGVLTDPVPEALTAVAEGTPTLATLQDTFPETARAGLAAARSAGEAGDAATGFGAFVRNQLNVRSVAPREGTSADAVLSRAEDALRTGRLNDALAEIGTLPESARTAMADWIALAEARAAAVDAADQLSATLTAN